MDIKELIKEWYRIAFYAVWWDEYIIVCKNGYYNRLSVLENLYSLGHQESVRKYHERDNHQQGL
jgi:hypothetical protein